MPFPLIFRMLIYIFPLLSIHHFLLCFVWHNVPYHWKVLPFGLATALGFLHPSQNLICSFAIAKVCILLSILMTSWSLFALSGQVKGHACFCVPCWSILVYTSIFPSPTFASLSPLLFGVVLGYCPHVGIFTS